MNGNALRSAPRRAAFRPVGWGRMLRLSALLLAATLSPAAWAPVVRRRIASQVCLTAMRTLPRFTLLSGLLSLVLVHVVLVTAQSYGLTQFALGAVIRVLVVELLPLAAALFVALHGGLADDAGMQEHDADAEDDVHETLAGRISSALLAQVSARAVAVVALATTAGGAALVLAYLGVYGFTPWGLAAFTRTVGQVFDPIVLMALGLKTALFAAAVATVPVACASGAGHADRPQAGATLHGTVRLFSLLIAVEMLSLVAVFF